MVSKRPVKILALIGFLFNLAAFSLTAIGMIALFALFAWIPFIGLIIGGMAVLATLPLLIVQIIFIVVLPFVGYGKIGDESNTTGAVLLILSSIIALILGIAGFFPEISMIFITTGIGLVLETIPHLIGGILLLIAGILATTIEPSEDILATRAPPTLPTEPRPPAPVPTELPTSALEPSTAKGEGFCTNCGAPIRGHEAFCTNCGASLRKD